MKMKKVLAVGLVGIAAVAFADANPWQFSVGPAWRTRVKGSISGATKSVYDKPEPGTSFDPADIETVQDPDYPTDPTMQKYAYTRTKSTTVMDGSDTDRPLGLRATLSRDIFEAGNFTFGLAATFAAYWRMETAISGQTLRTKDYYYFNGGPIPPEPVTWPFLPDPNPDSKTLPNVAVGRAARLRSDLYQIGLGPQAAWHVCDWLEAYGRVQVLCNLASLDFEAGAASSSETLCRLGFGAEVGIEANLTENIGLFGQVGYEWVDKADIRVGGLAAEVDFSSLVIAAGIRVRF